jgi:multimeric flavodoxin WrbA
MKITHIAASPRIKSTSTKIAKRFCDTGSKQGADVTSYSLGKMNYKGCQGCNSCKQGKDRCVLKDDLTPVLEALYETDVLVVSTPVYFWDVPGQLKCLIDRLYSVAKEDWETNPEPLRLPKGKKVVFIQTQKAEEDKHLDVYEKYATFFKLASWETHLLRACNGLLPEELRDHTEIMKQTDALAEKLTCV